MLSLRGKIVCITGAGSGIGRATAKAFARQGARLLLCGRRLDRLDTLAAELAAHHGAHFKDAASFDATRNLFTFRLDVRDRQAVEQTFAGLPDAWKSVDILINNAGLSRGLARLYEDDPENWEEMIDTNVKGLLYVTRALTPGMVARRSGHILSLGSTAGHQTYANGAVYCATKAAEKSIMEGLRIDLIGTGVRCTSVDPGMVETEFSEVRFRGDREKAANVYRNITPLQPEDIAETLLWAATQPAHVNVHTVVLTSIDQANSTVFNRRPS